MKFNFYGYMQSVRFDEVPMKLGDNAKNYCLCIILLMALYLLMGCQRGPEHTMRIGALSADAVTNQLVTISVDLFPLQYIRGEEGNPPQLQYFDPTTQQYTWISDLNGISPRDIEVDAENRRAFLVSRWDGVETLSAVDLNSGVESIVSNGFHGEGIEFVNSEDLIYDPISNVVFVASAVQNPDPIYQTSIIAVNPITGNRTLFAKLDLQFRKLAIDSVGRRLFAAYTNPSHGVLMFDLDTAEQTVLADIGKNIGIGNMLDGISNIVYYGAGQKLLITDGYSYDAEQNVLIADGYQVFEIDPLDGAGGLLFDASPLLQLSGWSAPTTLLNDVLIVLEGAKLSEKFNEPISDYLYALDLMTTSYYTLEEQRIEAEKPIINYLRITQATGEGVVTFFLIVLGALICTGGCPLPPWWPGP